MFARMRRVVVHKRPRPSIHAGDHPMNLFVDFDILNEHFGACRRPEGAARATVASCESYASGPAGRSSELYLRAGDFKDMPGKALYYGEVMRVAGEWLRRCFEEERAVLREAA